MYAIHGSLEFFSPMLFLFNLDASMDAATGQKGEATGIDFSPFSHRVCLTNDDWPSAIRT